MRTGSYVHNGSLPSDCGGTHTRRKKAGKASKSASREHSPESLLSEAMSAMTLKEREQQVLADIARIELENRVFELEEKRARLLLQRSRRGRTSLGAARPVDYAGNERLRRETTVPSCQNLCSGESSGALSPRSVGVLFHFLLKHPPLSHTYHTYGTTLSSLLLNYPLCSVGWVVWVRIVPWSPSKDPCDTM